MGILSKRPMAAPQIHQIELNRQNPQEMLGINLALKLR
jgi:hypothetical protein